MKTKRYIPFIIVAASVVTMAINHPQESIKSEDYSIVEVSDSIPEDTVRMSPQRTQQSDGEGTPGTLDAPEAPVTEGFVPTMMSDIKAADPTSGIDIIAPPTANQRGTASLQYPLQMPPARNGMQPQITITYNSDGGSGWLGEGWDISIPVISVDTRWGVPRYDTQYETETYLLNGQMLCTPDASGNMTVAHRGSQLQRTERQFFTRQAGEFAKIERKGTSPSNYSWIVTDNRGTKYLYGRTNASILSGIVANGSNAIAEWHLDSIIEIHGDYISFEYIKTNESVLGNVSSQAIYLHEVHAGNVGENAHTIVTFTNSGTQKIIRHSSARYGFLTSSNKLLSQIEVKFSKTKMNHALFRRYDLSYSTGEFGVQLLDSIKAYGPDGTNIISKQGFDYYDDTNNGMQLFLSDTTKISNSEIEDVGILSNFLPSTGDVSGKATMIGATKTKTTGASFYGGIGPNDSKTGKSNTAGMSIGYSKSTAEGISSLVDINGDGLPDKVYKRNGHLYFQPQVVSSGQYGFGEEHVIQSRSEFSKIKSSNYGGGFKVHMGLGPVTLVEGIDYGHFKSETTDYFSDVNADGLIDIVSGDKVYFNHLENGIPTFTLYSSDTPSYIAGGGTIDTTLIEVDQTEIDTLLYYSPMMDAVQVWVAPKTGTILLTSSVTLISPSGDEDIEGTPDGVRVAIQKGNSELAHSTITSLNPSWSPSNMSLSVEKGDRIYFRVQCGNQDKSNGSADKVNWTKGIAYADNEDSDYDDHPDGYSPWQYNPTHLMSAKNIVMVDRQPFTVIGNFTKPVTSDDVHVRIYTFNGNNPSNKTLIKDSLFIWSGTHSGNLNIPVNAQDVDSCVYLELYSPSNVAWQGITWNPSIVIYNNNSDTIRTIPRYHTYDEVYKDGLTIVPETSGTINIKPMISFSYGTYGTVYVTIKNMTGLKKRIQLDVSNGTITNNTYQSLTVDNHQKLWVDIYGDDEIVSRIQGDPYIEVQNYPQYNINDVGIYGFSEANDTLGFGHLFRGWGHFVYNASNGRCEAPIDESLLSMTSYAGDNYNILENAFVPMFPDLARRDRWLGPNENVWVSCNTNIISASRLVNNDISVSNPLASYAGNAAHEDGTAIGFPIISKGYSSDIMSGGSIPDFGNISATINNANGKTHTILSTMDMNGDGFPDLVSNKKITFTNPQGVFGGETIVTRQQDVSNSSTNYSLGGNPVFSHTTSKNKSEGSTDISQEHAKNSGCTVGADINASYNVNNDEVTCDYVDINGDGLPDMVYKNGNNFYYRLNLGYRFDVERSLSLSGFGIQKSEARSFTPSSGINLPFAVDKMASSFSAGIGVAAADNQEKLTLMDINADGLLDMVYRDNNNIIKVALGNGMGFLSNSTWNGLNRISKNVSVTGSVNAAASVSIPIFSLKLTLTLGANTGHSINRQLEGLRDIDGDGFLDIITSESENNLHVRYSAIRRTNKLRTVKNSLGGTFTLDYTHSTPTYGLSGGKWVLSEVVVDDGIHDDGPNMTTRFEYTNGIRDRHEREFLGFGEVITKEIDTNPDTLYRQTVQIFDVSSYYTQGNLLSTCVKDAQGRKYSEVNNTYYAYNMRRSGANNVFGTGSTNNPATKIAGDHGSVYAPLKYTENRQYEGGTTGVIMSQHIYTYYITSGSYGALEYHYYSDKGTMNVNTDASSDYRECYTYKNDLTQHVLNLPTSHYVYVGDSVVHRDSITYGSGKNTSKPLTVKKYYSPTQFAQTDFTNDSYGNVSSMTLPANHKGQRLSYTYEYEDTMNMYIKHIRSNDTLNYNTYFYNYDYRYGLPRQKRDINDFYTLTEYDALGRITSVTAPREYQSVNPHRPHTLSFTYSPLAVSDENGISQPAYAVTENYDVRHTTDPIETVTFVDGFGRVIQVKKDGYISSSSSVMIVSGLQQLDAFGRVTLTYYPCTEYKGYSNYDKTLLHGGHDNITPTQTSYDVMNRTVQIVMPDNTVTTSIYNLSNISGQSTFCTLVTDALGHQSASYTNGSGLTVKSSQFHNNTEIATLFLYDGIQRPRYTINCEGDTTSYTYDMLDRQTEVKHPASGTTKLSYDPAGNLLTKQTANLVDKGTMVSYAYDFDMLTSVTYPEHPENNVRYIYGVNASDGRNGRVAMKTDASGGTTYKYDALGNIIEENRTITVPYEGIFTFKTLWDYDSFGRLLSINYPDGEQITYGYDVGGQVNTVTGYKSQRRYNYVTDIRYNKFGLRTRINYGSGAYNQYTYKSDNLRLNTLQTHNGTSRVISNAYTYDDIGNITGISCTTTLPPTPDYSGDMAHTYAYDDLSRLTTASGTYTGQRLSGKTASYTLQMGYDDMYRVKRKGLYIEQDDVMAAGHLNAGYNLTYSYSDDAGRRFQLDSIAEDSIYRNITATGRTYLYKNHAFEYDKNGNMLYENTARKHKNGIFENKTSEIKYLWDEENRLSAISENGYVSCYLYDSDGNRTVKQHGGLSGHYVNSNANSQDIDSVNHVTDRRECVIYVNPFMTYTNPDRDDTYTKHIYIGGERIVSKIGDTSAYLNDPFTNFASYGMYGDLTYYQSKKDTLERVQTSNYEILGVPFIGIDNDTHEYGYPSMRSSGTDSLSLRGLGQGPYEDLQYYYHKDHLGSSVCITDSTGQIIQHVEYIPYGEVFIEERNPQSSYATPYKFNGKELDEETGLYYYGARYLHPKYAMWLSVDRFADNYPNMSSYNTFGDNPTHNIDINGDSIIVDNYGGIIANIGNDKGVYLQKQNNEYQKLGDMQGEVDVNYIYSNLLKKSVREAKKIWSPFTFKKKVVTGGIWDLKNNKKTIWGYDKDGKTRFLFEGSSMESQDIGNHHFGVVAKAYGMFTEYMILSQAGKYQIENNLSRPEWQNYIIVNVQRVSPSGIPYTISVKQMLPPYGDDPRDQMWIKKGFDYWKRNF